MAAMSPASTPRSRLLVRARGAAKKAAETKVATQMGTSYSMDDARAIEHIQVATSATQGGPRLDQLSYAYWPQGARRVSDGSFEEPRTERRRRGPPHDGGAEHPVSQPGGICSRPGAGGAAHPIYHPSNWRRYRLAGALGTWGAPDRPSVWSLSWACRRASRRFDAVQRRVLPDRDDDALRVRCPRPKPVVGRRG